jgi:hypothetical protein
MGAGMTFRISHLLVLLCCGCAGANLSGRVGVDATPAQIDCATVTCELKVEVEL